MVRKDRKTAIFLQLYPFNKIYLFYSINIHSLSHVAALSELPASGSNMGSPVHARLRTKNILIYCTANNDNPQMRCVQRKTEGPLPLYNDFEDDI